jgi:YidC/Oxa1 family membrane protein insertase
VPADRSEVLAESARFPVNPDRNHGRVAGSIALQGLRLDDLTLLGYRQEVGGSEEIVLLSPAGGPMAYFAEFGWVNAAGGATEVPGPDSLWVAEDGRQLDAGESVTFRWANDAGVVFRQTLELDENYLFRVTLSVVNPTAQELAFHPFGFVRREELPDLVGFYILHEGPLGVFNETLEEIDYDDLLDEAPQTFESTGGWIGITDKYWLTALVPDRTTSFRSRFSAPARPDGGERYQVDFLGPAMAVPAGGESVYATHFFAGAKEVDLLDGYRDELEIPLFDRAVDFGWFYPITKPLFYVLHWFSGLLGNVGLAILALTVCVRIALFPLANRSYAAMSRMKKVQPKMMEIRDRYKDDKQKMQQEVMELYRREKANPLSGCLPILLQIPIFFALYKVLFVTLETRHEPFYLWISDLSAQDPTTIFNLFGLLPFTPPGFLMVGALPLIMGATMYLQQKLNPTPPDPMQARIMMALPFVFVFIFAPFPAGLVLYWAWNNLLSIAQQWVIMRRMDAQT